MPDDPNPIEHAPGEAPAPPAPAAKDDAADEVGTVYCMCRGCDVQLGICTFCQY